MACPHKSHPDYKRLISEFGEGKALAAFTLNNDEIPSLERARELLNQQTSMPNLGPTGLAGFVAPLFQPSTGITQTSGATDFTNGTSFHEFSREEDINKKYPFATKMVNDIGTSIEIVDGKDLERNGRKIKALYDAWDNKIKASKDASPETIMHEILHGIFFKATQTKTEETFLKSPFGRDLAKFADSLNKISLPDNETIAKIMENIQEDSVQEAATYGILNYTMAKALNETSLANQKVPDNVFTDLAKSTLKGINVHNNSKLAELLNILDKNTRGKNVIEKPKTQVSPETTATIDRKFDKLKSIDKDVKFVREDKGTHIQTHFEVNGEKVKYKVNDEIVGIKSTVGKRSAVEVKDQMKEILDRYIDKDGLLKAIPDERELKGSTASSIYDMMEESLANRLKEYPTGTKFVHDINIFSEAWNKAAKLDFLALTPDGKADLLAFDVVGHSNYGYVTKDSPVRDVKDKDQALIRDYLNQVKGILKTSYDIKEFNQSRSVPIYITMKTNKSVTSIVDASWDGLNSAPANKKIIGDIPTWDEPTGNKDMDNLIKKLVALNEAKGGEKYSEANANSKKAIARSIRAIQLDKGIPSLVNMIDSSARSSELTVKEFEGVTRYKDTSDLKLEDLSTVAGKLNKSSKELDMYSNLYLYYKDYYPDPNDAEKKQLDKLKAASDRARLALIKLDEVKREFIQDKVAQKYGVENLLMPEKKVGWYEANVNTFDKPVTKAQYVFHRMISNARNRYQNKTRESLDELNEIHEKLQDWFKGKSNSDLLDLIKRKGDKGNRVNELISQFKKEFYTTAKDKIELTKSEKPEIRKEAIEWLRNNVDQESLKEWASKERAKRIRWIQQNITPSEYYYTEAIKDAELEFDIAKPFIYQNYSAIKQFPKKENWQTDEFNRLEQGSNAPVMALYKYARKINSLAARTGYIEGDKTSRFLPFLHKSLVEKTILGGSFSFTDAILNSLTVSKVDVDYGTYDRIANEQIDTIPKYFTRDFGTQKVDENGNKYVDHSNVSDDIVKNLALYAGKVLEYEEKSKLEEQVKLLLWAEKNKESLQTNSFGNVVADSEPLPSNEDNYRILKDFVQNQFYGQAYVKNKYTDAASRENISEKFNKIASKINKTVGFSLIKEQSEERRFSLMKSLQAAQALQNLKVLGLNIGASTYRFLGTNVQGWINSGEYYTQGDMFKHELKHSALQFYKGDAQLHIALLKQFLPVDSQIKHEMSHLSLSKLTAASASDMMMKMIERAHDYIQYVNFGAMMDNTIVIDGKIYNARKYIKASEEYRERYSKSGSDRKEIESSFEDRVKKLVEEHGIVKKSSIKDDKLVIEGLDMDHESVAQFKGLVRSVGRRLSGNISGENESRLRMTVLGRQLLMFKNWLPGMLNTRFTGLAHNEGLQDYEWGRVRMMGKIILQQGIRSIGKLTSMYKATERGVDLMSHLYEQKKADYEKDHLEEFKMTKEEFYDLVRKNIATQTKEVVAMMALAGTLAMVVNAAKGHDEKDKGYWAFVERTLDRAYEEVNLYYNPISMNSIINGSLFPTLGLLTDVSRFFGSVLQDGLGHVEGDEKMVNNAHPTKYLLKTIPLFSQVPNYIAILMPDVAKELGITVGAKKVSH